MTAAPQLSIREAWANPSLRSLTVAQFVSLAGDFLAVFAVFSVVSFRLHGSAAQVSGVMITYMLPQAFIAPLAGVFIDRWNAQTTMIASDLMRAVLVIALAFSTSIQQIDGVMILLSAISAFFAPAQTVAIRAVVPLNGLMAANSLLMQVMQISQIASPGLAGMLIERFGAAACFWLDSASFVFSAAMVAAIAVPRRTTVPSKTISSMWADLSFGVRSIFAQSRLALAVLAIAAGSFAVSCYSALTANYVRDILRASTSLYGLLGTLVGLGMILGTAGMTGLARSRLPDRLIMTGLAGIAAGILTLAIFGNIPVAVGATLGIGASAALVIIPAQTLMQSETPVDRIGRVSGSVRSVVALVQIAGLLLSGSVAGARGIRSSYLTIAILLTIAAGSIHSFSRSTRR